MKVRYGRSTNLDDLVRPGSLHYLLSVWDDCFVPTVSLNWVLWVQPRAGIVKIGIIIGFQFRWVLLHLSWLFSNLLLDISWNLCSELFGYVLWAWVFEPALLYVLVQLTRHQPVFLFFHEIYRFLENCLLLFAWPVRFFLICRISHGHLLFVRHLLSWASCALLVDIS